MHAIELQQNCDPILEDNTEERTPEFYEKLQELFDLKAMIAVPSAKTVDEAWSHISFQNLFERLNDVESIAAIN